MGLDVDFGVSGDKFLIQRLRDEPKKATRAANLAISSATEYGYRLAKTEIGKQVNLKPGYISQNLSIVRSRIGDISRNEIRGRFRATSLARFEPKKISGRKGISVKVKTRKKIPKAFLLNLKNGNRGLAIRVPKGETPSRRLANAKPLYKKGNGGASNQDVYLLYGPSVDQVLRNDTITKTLVPKVTRYLNAEFTRQYVRL